MSIRSSLEAMYNGLPTNDEQLSKNFDRRLLEFWAIVDMSFSSIIDDRFITIYDAFNPPEKAATYAYWCPLRLEHTPLKKWLSYSLRVREAIRQGFRVGVGRMLDWHGEVNYAEWINAKDASLPDLKINMLLLVNMVRSGKNFELGTQEIDSLLNNIYSKGNFIPYHPLFDQRFKTQLSATPLHEVTGFLEGECTQYNLLTKEGIDYLSDLVADLKAVGSISIVANSRATSWISNVSSELDAKASEQNKTVQPTIADLCQNGFTASDMADLLRFLGLIDQNNTCIIAEGVKGRAAGKRSKFTAAYRVLRYKELLANTKSNLEWANAFNKAYKMQLSSKVLAYDLSANGRASELTSKDFQTGVEEVKHWVEEWRQARTKSPA